MSPRDADRAALVALYHTTGGPSWHSNRNWLSEAPLDRITASTRTPTAAHLECGSCGRLRGTLPPELGGLSELEELRLEDNHACVERSPPELTPPHLP